MTPTLEVNHQDIDEQPTKPLLQTPIPVISDTHSVTPKSPGPNSQFSTEKPRDEDGSTTLVPCGFLLPLPSSDIREPSPHLDIEIPKDLVPEAAYPALNRIIQAPDTVGLAAFQVGREDKGVYLNADQPMPLASVVKIINLIAYADAVAEGELDPSEWVPLGDLERSYLPGMDLGAQRRAIEGLGERGLIAGNPPTTPLEEVPWMMIRHSSNAAADYLHLRLGQERIERTAQYLGLKSQTAICPWIGQFLAISNHQRNGSDMTAIQSFINEKELYGYEVMHLTDAFVTDRSFREEESKPGLRRRTIDAQRLFSENLNGQASARDYASLMATIIRNELKTPYTNILVRRVLEWPMEFPDNQILFSTLGLKDGSLPGVLTTVYYAQRREDGGQIIVALFFRDLPMQTYRNWRQTLPHDEFARWLLTDPEAIPTLRSILDG